MIQAWSGAEVCPKITGLICKTVNVDSNFFLSSLA